MSLLHMLTGARSLPFADRNADGYTIEHGQPPILGVSALPPWRYYGWLRLLVQQLHTAAAAQGVFPDRWGYFFRLLAAEELGADPIPPVHYTTARGDGYKQVERALVVRPHV